MLNKLSGIDPKMVKKDYSDGKRIKLKMRDVLKSLSLPKGNISSFGDEMEDKAAAVAGDAADALKKRQYEPYSSSMKSIGQYQRPMSNQNIAGSFLKKGKNG
jgi:hypothetical protein